MAPDSKDNWFLQVKEKTSGPISTQEIITRLVTKTLAVTNRISRDKVTFRAIYIENHIETVLQRMIQELLPVTSPSESKSARPRSLEQKPQEQKPREQKTADPLTGTLKLQDHSKTVKLREYSQTMKINSQTQNQSFDQDPNKVFLAENAGDDLETQEPNRKESDSTGPDGGIRQKIRQTQKSIETNVKTTFELNDLRKVLDDIKMQRKIAVKVPIKNQPKKTDDRGQDIKARYVLEDRREDTSRGNENKRLLFSILVSALVLFSQVCYMYYEQGKDGGASARNETVIKEALEYQTLGQTDKALQALEKIRTANLTVHSMLEMAEIYLKQNNNKEAESLAQKALTMSKDKKETSRAHCILGLTAMRAGDQNSAEQDFQDSVTEDPDSYVALYNRAILHLNQNQPEIAEELLLKALSIAGTKAPILLGLFDVALMIDSNLRKQNADLTSNLERFERIDRMMAEFTKKTDNYKAEILIARIHLTVIKRFWQSTESLIKEFINLNPHSVAMSTSDPIFNLERMSWQNVYSWCLNSYGPIHAQAMSGSFIAGCLLQVGKTKDALVYAKFSYQELPHDSLVKGMYAFTLYADGQPEAVKTLLQNDKDGPSKLSLLALAHVSKEQKDVINALKYWQKIYSLDSSDPTATEALAGSYFQRGDYKNAKTVLHDGMSRYPASQGLRKLANDIQTTEVAP